MSSLYQIQMYMSTTNSNYFFLSVNLIIDLVLAAKSDEDICESRKDMIWEGQSLGAVSFAVASRADACAVASVTGIIHSAFTSAFRAFLVN